MLSNFHLIGCGASGKNSIKNFAFGNIRTNKFVSNAISHLSWKLITQFCNRTSLYAANICFSEIPTIFAGFLLHPIPENKLEYFQGLQFSLSIYLLMEIDQSSIRFSKSQFLISKARIRTQGLRVAKNAFPPKISPSQQ